MNVNGWKKQKIALMEDNMRATSRNRIIEISIKFYGYLYEEPETHDEHRESTKRTKRFQKFF